MRFSRSLVAAGLALAAAMTSPVFASELVEQGEYLLRAGGCVSCHTDKQNGGEFLAGGRALRTPFGTFYSPNITSDPEHGIGAWTADEFFTAMRHGVSPSGEYYYPVFPYPAYTGIRVEDLVALFAYLKQTPAVAEPNRSHDIPWYLQYRIANRGWNLLFLDTGPYENDPAHDETWNRGAYLVNALTHCGECHTPRDRFGALEQDRAMAGAAMPPSDDVAPNITPNTNDGIGNWKPSTLVKFLKTGLYWDGEFTEGPMAEVVDNGTSYLSEADLEAIAEYILSLPPLGD